MANHDNEIFVTVLRITENNNRSDLEIDLIYKEIEKSIDFEDVTKEFLDDRIHTLINDGKIINIKSKR